MKDHYEWGEADIKYQQAGGMLMLKKDDDAKVGINKQDSAKLGNRGT